MNRSGRTLMNWKRSLTQARMPKAPAATHPLVGAVGRLPGCGRTEAPRRRCHDASHDEACGESDHGAGRATDQGAGRAHDQHRRRGRDRDQRVLLEALARERDRRHDPPRQRKGKRAHQAGGHQRAELAHRGVAQEQVGAEAERGAPQPEDDRSAHSATSGAARRPKARADPIGDARPHPDPRDEGGDHDHLGAEGDQAGAIGPLDPGDGDAVHAQGAERRPSAPRRRARAPVPKARAGARGVARALGDRHGSAMPPAFPTMSPRLSPLRPLGAARPADPGLEA